MKLGILTFHSAHNYGAVLQAYAMQEYLCSQGHDAYIIDYRPEYITRCYPISGKSYWASYEIKKIIMGLYNYVACRKIRLRRWYKFEEFFPEKLRLYPYHEGMDFHEFDAVFIGSDQVWSAPHTDGKFDDMYFGENFKCKAIPYAPSCTHLVWNDEEKEYLRKHLDSLSAISVREMQMKEALQPLTKNDISVVIDPTLLAGREHFEKIAAPINNKRPYILTYEIGDHPEVYQMAKTLAKKIDGDVIELVNSFHHYHRSSMREGASIEEFLGYIKNAACVLTTSFHGTALSIIFGTPFYTVLQHSAADNRMTSLLAALDMKDRAINMDDEPDIIPLDTQRVNDNLQKLRKESEEYIKKSLQL